MKLGASLIIKKQRITLSIMEKVDPKPPFFSFLFPYILEGLTDEILMFLEKANLVRC
jgi:hypothetical protein